MAICANQKLVAGCHFLNECSILFLSVMSVQILFVSATKVFIVFSSSGTQRYERGYATTYYLLLKEVINMNHTYHAKSSVWHKWICEWLNSYLSYCLLMAYLNILSAYQFPKAPVLQPLALIPICHNPSCKNIHSKKKLTMVCWLPLKLLKCGHTNH